MSYTVNDLPQSARTIAEVIGIDATLILVDRFGKPSVRGRGRVHVPHPENLSPNHRLAEAIGVPLATRLSQTFGGEVLYIPNCENALIRARIWAAYMGGKSEADVAVEFGITERRVRQITAEERGPLPQDFMARIGAAPRSSSRAAQDRLNGLLGGRSKEMLRSIIAAWSLRNGSFESLMHTAIQKIDPYLVLEMDETHRKDISIDQAIELVAVRLPAEIVIKHGDQSSLMVIKPSKGTSARTPLLIRIAAPPSPRQLTQQAWVIATIDALAHAAVIDKTTGAETLAPAKVTVSVAPDGDACRKS